MSGSGRETSGLWQSGEPAIPLSDENAADSMSRRCATLLRFTFDFCLRGLVRAPLGRAELGSGGGVRGGLRSPGDVRQERDIPPSSGSLSDSTRGLRYLR